MFKQDKIHLLIFFLMIFLTTIPSPVFGLTPVELADKAEREYHSGNYQEAIQAWEALIHLGYVNGNVYYNMGNAYWQKGKIGHARLYFLKAERLKPRDGDIRHNLMFLREKLEESVPPAGLLTLLQRLPWYKLSLNSNESLILAAVFSALLFGLLLRSKIKRLPMPMARVGFLALCLIYFGSQWSYQEWKNQFSPKAVVLENKIPLLKIPTEDALTGQNLNEGSLVEIKKKQGKYRLVKTSSGREGWIQSEPLGEI